MNITKKNFLFTAACFLLFGAIIFLLVKVQMNNVSIDNSEASGFGVNATRTVYVQTAESFLNTRCEDVFTENYENNPDFPEIKKYDLRNKITTRKVFNGIPLQCNYKFDNGKEITIMIYAYNKNSGIDVSREELHARMNGVTITDIFDVDRIGIMDYYLGYDKFDKNTCRTNFFHPLNDFEMASIFYKGFDCEEIFNLNREVTSVFGNYVFYTMEYIYATALTATEKLLYTFSSSEYIDGLKFYGN